MVKSLVHYNRICIVNNKWKFDGEMVLIALFKIWRLIATFQNDGS